MLRSVKTAPTDMSANPSHLGGETTFRLAVPCQAFGVIVSSGVICAATTWLEKSLNVKDSTIRSWMPIKNTIKTNKNEYVVFLEVFHFFPGQFFPLELEKPWKT